MSCKVTCPYFPNPLDVKYSVDDFGVKHCSYRFICGFNSEVINSWDMKCPRDHKEKKIDKRRRK